MRMRNISYVLDLGGMTTQVAVEYGATPALGQSSIAGSEALDASTLSDQDRAGSVQIVSGLTSPERILQFRWERSVHERSDYPLRDHTRRRPYANERGQIKVVMAKNGGTTATVTLYS